MEEALKKTNAVMKKKWDAKKKSEVEWKNGDLVWVDTPHYNTDQPSKKLSAKQLGPFPIIQKIGNRLMSSKFYPCGNLFIQSSTSHILHHM